MRAHITTMGTNNVFQNVCRESYDDSWFSVVRSASSFKQLKVLEAVYIRIRDPNLCK